MTKKPISKIALPCFLAGFISAIVSHRIGLKYFPFIPRQILVFISVTYLIGILVYIFIGLRRLVRKQEDHSGLLAFWQNAIRYILALDILVFGICKFFHLQFNTPLAILDNPFNTIDNSTLMWAFFGRSHPFTLLIGSLEIIGALMLIFRKTRLLGVIFLLPICFNIFVLDVFYNGVVTSVYIAIEITGLIYLLLIEYNRLYKFFFVDKSELPTYQFKSSKLKNLVKLSVIIIPFMLMAINKYPQYYPDINGKYKVERLMINKQLQPSACADSVLTKIYIDKNDIVFEYNSYKRRFIGSYKYDPSTKQFIANWRYPQKMRDTLFAEIVPTSSANQKTLKGRMGKQLLEINLKRINNGIDN